MPRSAANTPQYGPFRELFPELLRRKQNLPLGRINLRAFCAGIPEYDYSTLRRMITGPMRLQPRAIELMAAALEVPPETFLEYQAFQIMEVLKAHPELCPQLYETVRNHGRVLDELKEAQTKKAQARKSKGNDQ